MKFYRKLRGTGVMAFFFSYFFFEKKFLKCSQLFQWAFICPLSTSMPKILDLSPKLSWENWFCGFIHSDFCKIYNFTLSIPNGCWWVSFSDSFSWIWIWICQTAWTNKIFFFWNFAGLNILYKTSSFSYNFFFISLCSIFSYKYPMIFVPIERCSFLF